MRLFQQVFLATTAITPSFALKNAAIDKVVSMLKDMESKGKVEKQEEQVDFAAFSTWCDNTKAEKAADIEASELAIKQYEAQALQGETRAAEQTDAANAAKDSIATSQADLAAMKKVRSEENSEYITEKTDLQDSVYACEKAIMTLSAVPEKVGAVSSFLQMQFNKLRKLDHKRSLHSHLAKVQSFLSNVEKQPFTAASERKSDTVINLLQNLKTQFEEELVARTKREGEAAHSHDLAVQTELQNIANQEKIEKESTATATEAAKAAGEAKKSHANESKSLEDTKKYLNTVTADCELKSKDFAARQKSRQDEIDAIAQAVSVLSGEVMQAGAGHLNRAQSVGGLLQTKSKTTTLAEIKKISLRKAQNLSKLKHKNKVDQKTKNWEGNVKVAAFLREHAVKLESKMLMQLAEAATADPFVKVREMITTLVNRLEAEAKAELTHKGKCDKDMAANAANIQEFTTKVEKLTNEIEVLNSDIAEAKKSKERLTTEISDMKKDLATATTNRATEKSENEKTISESKAAEGALDQAMSVLQNYYASTQGSALLEVQNKQAASQPVFEAGAYQAMGQEGVIGLLEVVKSQMAQLIRETTSSEASASKLHDEFTTETEATIASKTATLRSTEQTLTQMQEDLTDADQGLNGEEGAKAQLEMYRKELQEVLTPMCIHQGVSFEERDAKRQGEIKSLQEALEILASFTASD